LKNKLTDILFLVALAFKLLAEADMAIHSVAYLVCEQAEEELTSQLSDKLIDKITDNLSGPIAKLADIVASTKRFLDATLQKQAAELLPTGFSQTTK
jgi:hypothetical protein